MAGERGTERAGDPASWWSTGAVPDDLPSWAHRGLTEAAGEFAPSAPAPTPTRRRRATANGSRLRGWGLAVASVAAAAAAVPLAISTLASSDDADNLPRVGTFPVVAPGSLDPVPGVSPGRAPAGRGPTADAATLPPMDDPTDVEAAPRTIAPRAITRTRTATPTRTTVADDETATRTPLEVDATAAEATDDDSPGGGAGGGASGSPGGGGGRSADGGGSGSGGSGSGGESSSGGEDSSGGGGVVDGVVNGADNTVHGVTGLVR